MTRCCIRMFWSWKNIYKIYFHVNLYPFYAAVLCNRCVASSGLISLDSIWEVEINSIHFFSKVPCRGSVIFNSKSNHPCDFLKESLCSTVTFHLLHTAWFPPQARGRHELTQYREDRSNSSKNCWKDILPSASAC